MSTKYKFKNPDGTYFITFAVVEWQKIFSNDKYCRIIIDSLDYCQKNKGLELFAWVLMPNHVHLIARRKSNLTMSEILRDFKSHTAKKVIRVLKEDTFHIGRTSLLTCFRNAGRRKSNVKQYQFWRHDNHPLELCSNKAIDSRLNYLHNNPVKAGLCSSPEEYTYSSALNYAGERGLLDVTLIHNNW